MLSEMNSLLGQRFAFVALRRHSMRRFSATVSATRISQSHVHSLSLGYPATVKTAQLRHITTSIPRMFSSASSSFPIVVPSLGESISEGTVLKISTESGRSVKADEILLTLETDKVTVDVRAPKDGVISSVLVKPGDNVAVGGQLFMMSFSSASGSSSQPPIPQTTETKSEKATTSSPTPTTPPSSQSSSSTNSSHRIPLIRFPKRKSGGYALAHPAKALPPIPAPVVKPPSSLKKSWEPTNKPPPTAVNATVIVTNSIVPPFPTTVPLTTTEILIINGGGAWDPVDTTKKPSAKRK